MHLNTNNVGCKPSSSRDINVDKDVDTWMNAKDSILRKLLITFKISTHIGQIMFN